MRRGSGRVHLQRIQSRGGNVGAGHMMDHGTEGERISREGHRYSGDLRCIQGWGWVYPLRQGTCQE